MGDVSRKEKTEFEKLFDQWLELPETVIGEIIDSELHVSPRPSPSQASANSVLGIEIGGPFHLGRGGPGGWWILDEPEVHIDSNITVPDMAGWKRSRMPQLPTELYFSSVPDWICEILSPSTAVFDRVKKMPLYAQQGVKHIWLVDVRVKTLEVYENQNGKWLLLRSYSNNDMIRAVPFELIEFNLASLWQ